MSSLGSDETRLSLSSALRDDDTEALTNDAPNEIVDKFHVNNTHQSDSASIMSWKFWLDNSEEFQIHLRKTAKNKNEPFVFFRVQSTGVAPLPSTRLISQAQALQARKYFSYH